MEGAQIGLLVVRLWLLLCACVVLGLSADLATLFKSTDFQYACKIEEDRNTCYLANLLPDTEYAAFVGAWGLIQVIVGLVAVFANIPWIAILVVDVLALIFYLAGGITLAVWIGKYSCPFGSICTRLKADEAFLWLGFIGTIAAVALVFMWNRKR